MTKFQDEQVCRDYLAQHRWKGKPVCPYCGFNKSYRIENGKRFKCANKECHKKFSVTVGTVAEDTNISLSTWFGAIYLVASHKKGISSIQLGKDLGIAQKTAWFMLHRIREALREKKGLLLINEVQADETYVGGREENKHESKRVKTRDNKTAVVGAKETGGKIVTKVIPWVTKKNVGDFIEKTVDKKATLITDGSAAYTKIGKKYEHVIINHTAGQYVFNGYTTNGMENYWSLLKRGIYGIYHQVSPKHLERYCDEFAYRFNSRKTPDNERFEVILGHLTGRLTYDQLTAKRNIKDNGEEIEFTETGE